MNAGRTILCAAHHANLDCIDLDESKAYGGATFSDVISKQKLYDKVVARGDKPKFVRPNNPYFITCEKIVLTSNAIPSNTLLFKTRNFEFTLIERKFANELLDLAVSEGGSEDCSFWLIEPAATFEDYAKQQIEYE